MTINEPFIPGILFEFFSKCTIYKKYEKRVKIYSLIAFATILLSFCILNIIGYKYFRNSLLLLQIISIEVIILASIIDTFFEFKSEKSFEIIMIEKILSKLSNIMIGLVFIKGYSLEHENDKDKTDTLYAVLNRETTQLQSLISTLLNNSNNIKFKNEYNYLINNEKIKNCIDQLNKNILDLFSKLQNFNHCDEFEHSNIIYYVSKFLENKNNYMINVYYNSIFGFSDNWIWCDKLVIRHIRSVSNKKWLCEKLDGIQSKNGNKKSKKSENSLE